MGLLDGRVILVTASLTSLGREVARAVLREGGCVALSDTAAAPLEAIRRELDPSLARSTASAIDLHEQASCEAVVAQVVDVFGRLDGVAHVAHASSGSTVTAWERSSDVDIEGALRVAKAGGTAMERCGGGRIVMVGTETVSTETGDDGRRGSAPRGAQVAMRSTTHYLSKETGSRSVRIDDLPGDVSPGDDGEGVGSYEGWTDDAGILPDDVIRPVKLSITLHRLADDADVASTVVFFLSDLSTNVSGQTLYAREPIATA
ncbi:SDR family oxidoreductase [Herbiconiux sp. P15]|uniref:SDR family oxidoreductase n=1 Tax=Herbiconiux liukaitaii TaxID=3342799 RepID=UPI0035B99461